MGDESAMCEMCLLHFVEHSSPAYYIYAFRSTQIGDVVAGE